MPAPDPRTRRESRSAHRPGCSRRSCGRRAPPRRSLDSPARAACRRQSEASKTKRSSADPADGERGPGELESSEESRSIRPGAYHASLHGPAPDPKSSRDAPETASGPTTTTGVPRPSRILWFSSPERPSNRELESLTNGATARTDSVPAGSQSTRIDSDSASTANSCPVVRISREATTSGEKEADQRLPTTAGQRRALASQLTASRATEDAGHAPGFASDGPAW